MKYGGKHDIADSLWEWHIFLVVEALSEPACLKISLKRIYSTNTVGPTIFEDVKWNLKG